MDYQEEIEFRKRIHIKNLKRKLSKMSGHAELTDDYIALKKEIEEKERSL